MSNFYTEPFVSAGEMEFPSQPYITAQPQNHTATGPEEYVLKVIAAGAVSYQWEVFDGESWSTIPGATSDTLTINIDSSMDGWRYRVLVTGADGSTVVSKAAQIAVKGVQEITLEGAIVTFDGPARIKSLEADINPVQSGTGDPSPDNIRPISGWNAVNVVRTGENLFRPSDGSEYSTSLSKVTCVDGVYKNESISSSPWSMLNILSGAVITDFGLDDVIPAGTYSFSMNVVEAVSVTYNVAYVRLTLTDTVTNTDITIAHNGHATLTHPCKIKQITTISGWTIQPNGYIRFTIMLNVGSSATAYSPYNGTTYPASLGQTVYGGAIDVVSGVLIINKAIFDLGSKNWTVSNHRMNTVSALSDALSGNHANCICTMYKSDVGAATRSVDMSICFANNGYVYIYDTSFDGDATAFKQMLIDNNAQLVYELATPITVQLTPTEVATLTGVNNIWADSGDIIVTIIR